MIGFILFLLVWGAIVGGLGRLALPGPDPMSIGETILIGVVSSLVAGVLFRIIFNTGGGIIGSVLVATGAVYLVRRSRGGAISR
ncbi:MAG TPA: GlsB/YeaQ/YmgE family stress response membrane protein [Acidimicrobiia bacterium]|nr:GlsB/YeaQ/YmgE family stress response membrane protein [Acidimicrobiia bacterium]